MNKCMICGKTEELSAIPVMEVFSSTRQLFTCPVHYREVEDTAKKMSF